jgi:hypothetical protein
VLIRILHLYQKREKKDRQDSPGTKGLAAGQSSVPGTGTGGMLLS